MSARRCPWYGEMAARIDSASIVLYACEPASARWRRATSRRSVVGPGSVTLLPPGTRPADLTWPPIPLVADVTGLAGDELYELAKALARDGCELAFLIDRQTPSRTVRLIAEE